MNIDASALCKHRFRYPNTFCYPVTEHVKMVTKYGSTVQCICRLNLLMKFGDDVDKNATFMACVTLWFNLFVWFLVN